jgi:hypothetical protein
VSQKRRASGFPSSPPSNHPFHSLFPFSPSHRSGSGSVHHIIHAQHTHPLQAGRGLWRKGPKSKIARHWCLVETNTPSGARCLHPLGIAGILAFGCLQATGRRIIARVRAMGRAQHFVDVSRFCLSLTAISCWYVEDAGLNPPPSTSVLPASFVSSERALL